MSPEALFLLMLKICVSGLIISGQNNLPRNSLIQLWDVSESPGLLVSGSQSLCWAAGAAHYLTLLSSADPFKVDPGGIPGFGWDLLKERALPTSEKQRKKDECQREADLMCLRVDMFRNHQNIVKEAVLREHDQ